ncbi:flagella basal body P-ring formation protein FlgA [Thermomonas brevis]
MLALLATSAAAQAQQATQPLEPIRQAALAALQAEGDAQAMIAPGLRLAPCGQALIAVPSGAAVAEVRCADTPGWRLYVPVRRTATATATAQARMPNAAEESPESAVMVKRGDPVMLRAGIGGTEVRMGGKALGQARTGGILNVENDSSHRIVRGRLLADGSVQVVN